MLRREGWAVNAKRIYRLYTQIDWRCGRKCARRSRDLHAYRHKVQLAQRKVSMDFVAARLLDGRWFRVLTVVDQFTRECLLPPG